MRCLPLSSVLLAPPAMAAKWDIVPTLFVEEVYTDNVTLSGTAPLSDWVTVVTPGFNVTADGARLKFNLIYGLETIYHQRQSIDSGINHRLNAFGTAELTEKLFYLDARAAVRQQNVSLQGPLAVSNINATGNRTSVKTFSLSPYLRHQFGHAAEGEARYTYGLVEEDTGGFGKSETNRVDLRLTSGPSYKLYTWNLAAKKERVDTERQAGQTEFSSIEATGRRLITYNLYITSSIGYEENNYLAVGGTNPSGMSWSTGFDWTPTPRTRLAATFGKRYFGDTYALDFKHRTRLTTWAATYSENITTTQSQLLLPVSSSTADYLDGLFVTKIPDPVARAQAIQQFIQSSGLPPSLIVPTEFLTNQVYLVKRWQMSGGLQGVRHTVLGNFYTQTQESQSVSAAINAGDFAQSSTIKQTGASVVWNWRITPVDNSNLAVGYTRNELPSSNREDSQKYVRLGVSHQIDRNTVGAVNLRRLQNESNLPNGGYTENAVSAHLQMRF